MISVVVLTHNDEEILPRCLASVLWCDEVIIVDDQSTDGTVAVAKKHGAKVFVHPLQNDFAAQRNFGISKANGPASTRGGSSTRGGDWILFVDSDEVVTPQLADEIKQALEIPNLKSQIPNEGYFVKRKDWLFGRWLTHGETGHVKLLRLAKKKAGKWVQPVHEEWNIKGDVGELTYPLLHYPHQNVAQFLSEINHYSGLYAHYLFDRGIKEPGWQIAGKPLAKFFVNYIWRLGFLDGTPGIVVALMMNFHSFLVRAKLWQLRDARKKDIL